MNLPLIRILIISFFIPVVCFSQSDGIEEITPSQFALKQCSFDKEADAVVLFDKATSNYDDEYRLITTRRVRIKILTDNGVERANIKIPYYTKNDFEIIRKVGAVSITQEETNEPKRTFLDKRSVFDRKKNELYSEVSFAIPNVKKGSIIEYWYESVMEHYGGLQDWYFQSDLPVMVSHYNLYVVPNAVFSYVVKKSESLDVDINRDPQTGRVSFTMRNIPGLRNESFSPSFRNYLQRIDFQLSAVVTRYGSTIKYTNTWRDLNKELLDDKNFGGAIRKSLLNSELKTMLQSAPDPYGKMVLLFNYVRNTISWTQYESRYAIENLKNVLEKKKGNSGEINLLLINLLKGVDLDVYPMLVSERTHGKVDSSYSFLDQFNKTVAYVDISGMKYILDATDYSTPVNMIPVELLNTIGFKVDKKDYGFVVLQDKMKKRSVSINITGEVADDLVNEKLRLMQFDYARVGNAQRYLSDRSGYREQFFRSVSNVDIDSFELQNLEQDSLALVHDMDLKYQLNKTGDYYLLNYGMFTGFEKNPFISENRFTNIDFGAPQTTILNARYILPADMVVESLPKNTRMIVPGEDIIAAREIDHSGNELKISIRIDIKSAEYSVNDYLTLQEFFKKLSEMLNEPVVLKKK